MLRKILLILLIGSLLNIQGSHANPRVDVTGLIKQAIDVFKDIVTSLKASTTDLQEAEDITYVTGSIQALRQHMGKQQIAALDEIQKLNGAAVVAISASRAVVVTLRNTCENLLAMLGNKNDGQHLKFAIETYLNVAENIEPEVNIVVEKLLRVHKQADTFNAQLNSLKIWISLKKAQLIVKTKQEIEEERAKAYGAAAACLAWGPFAVFACPAAYALAAGITEGDTVRDIENSFNRGTQEINNIQSDISSIGKRTQNLVSRVADDKEEMKTIRKKINLANLQGRETVDNADLFLEVFKKSVKSLLDICKSYPTRK